MAFSNGDGGPGSALSEITSRRPDCVVTDHNMPGMDGLQVLERLKRRHPQIEVIVATAFAEIEPKESARDRVKRFEALTKVSPDNPETKMLLAELLIAAEDFPGARRAMGDLAETAVDE